MAGRSAPGAPRRAARRAVWLVGVAAFALALAAGTGCGGDGDDTSDGGSDSGSDAPSGCPAASMSSVTGTVAGQSLDPIASVWYQEQATPPSLVVLDELAGECGAPTQGTGQRLVLAFCAPVVTGEYTIVTAAAFPDTPCLGENLALVAIEESASAIDVALADSGIIRIMNSDGCVSGGFDADFAGGESLSGAFAARICGP